MQVKVRYYLHFRELLGKKEETFTMPKGAGVGDLVMAVLSRYEVQLAKIAQYQVFRGSKMAEADEELADGDVISLTTPLAGG